MKKRHSKKTNVLLVNITRLGDMLQATPTITGVKAENPDCKVTVVVEKQFADVCHFIPDIDEVVGVDLSYVVRNLAREEVGIVDAYEYISEFVGDLKTRHFDYCLNMSSSAYTALLIKLLGITRSGGWSADEEGYRVIESEWARLFATSVYHQNRQYNSLNLVDVFRCSADVEEHPRKLQLSIARKETEFAQELIAKSPLGKSSGPIIALQAGASQDKRQWAPERFSELTNVLTEKYGCRVVFTGTKKERDLIDRIIKGCRSSNIFNAAGETSIPQLAGLLGCCDLLITGDTGTMHMAVAAGTPVVAMFLASAYGFETGPYSEGNIVIQPIIGCGPCNPNKPCAGLECHDTIDPKIVAELSAARLKGPLKELPSSLAGVRSAWIYQSFFDQHGFCDMKLLNPWAVDPLAPYRDAYRKVWLSDIGGLDSDRSHSVGSANGALRILKPQTDGIGNLVELADQGLNLIEELQKLIALPTSSTRRLGEVSENLTSIDRRIEQLGFHYSHLGPLSRMFIFGKENLQGTDAAVLASQMKDVYGALRRRTELFANFLEA